MSAGYLLEFFGGEVCLCADVMEWLVLAGFGGRSLRGHTQHALQGV